MKMLLFCTTLGLLLSATPVTVAQQSPAPAAHSSPPVILVTPGIGGNSAPMTPERQALIDQTRQIDRDALVALQAGQYALAEAEERQSIALRPGSGVSEEVLARALDAQGKEQEALQAYRAMVIVEKDGIKGQTRVLLPYALLLLKSGQWGQALAVYNQAVTSLPSIGPHRETPIVQDGDVIRANSYFSPDVPEPAALAVAIHVARGLTYNGECDFDRRPQNIAAMAEYGKALQLAPDSPLANYYYSVGWQQLNTSERAKMGSAQQAKAALQKAVLLGKGDVKKAALKALKGFNKPA